MNYMENCIKLLNSIRVQPAEELHKTVTVEGALWYMAMDALDISSSIELRTTEQLAYDCAKQHRVIRVLSMTMDRLLSKMVDLQDINKTLKQQLTDIEEDVNLQKLFSIDGETESRMRAIITENSELKEINKGLTGSDISKGLADSLMKRIAKLEQENNILKSQNNKDVVKSSGFSNEFKEQAKATGERKSKSLRTLDDNIICVNARLGFTAYQIEHIMGWSQPQVLKIMKEHLCFLSKEERNAIKVPGQKFYIGDDKWIDID